MTQQPLVIAHRGNSSVAPQNTLAAFEAAWRAGADMIEMDAQVSRDGVAVVIHDDTLEATSDGNGPVSGHLASELAALDAGSWFAPAYAGQRIPLFEEVVTFLVERPGIDVLLELKGAWDVEPARRVVEAIDAAGLAHRVIAQSFWPRTMRVLAEVGPHLRRGLLIADLTDEVLPLCRELEAVTCNPAGSLLLEHPGLVGEIQAAGMRAMVWTVNEPEHWSQLLAARVDAIITDRPDRLRGWLSVR
ncbi:MAG: hypothetical protein JJE50_10780 [Actinomycetales bacterium]|nr:hypothetical protein [Actinomycetales bacterium]